MKFYFKVEKRVEANRPFQGDESSTPSSPRMQWCDWFSAHCTRYSGQIVPGRVPGSFLSSNTRQNEENLPINRDFRYTKSKNWQVNCTRSEYPAIFLGQIVPGRVPKSTQSHHCKESRMLAACCLFCKPAASIPRLTLFPSSYVAV